MQLGILEDVWLCTVQFFLPAVSKVSISHRMEKHNSPHPTPKLPLPRFSSHFVRFVRKKKKKSVETISPSSGTLARYLFFFFPLITSVNVISNQKNSGRLWAFSSRQVVSSFCCSSFFVGRQNEFSFFLLHNS